MSFNNNFPLGGTEFISGDQGRFPVNVNQLRAQEQMRLQREQFQQYQNLQKLSLASSPDMILRGGAPNAHQRENYLKDMHKHWFDRSRETIRSRQETLDGKSAAERVNERIRDDEMLRQFEVANELTGIIDRIDAKAQGTLLQDAKINPQHFLFDISKALERIAQWENAPGSPLRGNPALQEAKQYLASWYQSIGSSPAYPRQTPPGVQPFLEGAFPERGPDQKRISKELGTLGRLVGVIGFGGLAALNASISMFSKQHDYVAAGIYAGLAGVSLYGPKRLFHEKSSDRLLREVRFLGEPGNYWEQVQLRYGIKGKQWAEFIEDVQENKGAYADVVRAIKNKKPLTQEQIQDTLDALGPNAKIRAQVARMLQTNRGEDFLAFTHLVNSPKQQETRRLVRDYVEVGAGPDVFSRMRIPNGMV